MNRKRWLLGGLLLALAVAVSAAVAGYLFRARPSDPEPIDPWFQEVADEAGVDFVHRVGDPSTYAMPQINGSGVAVLDFDGDGLLDLYFLTHGGPGSPSTNRLYRNKGGGSFED